MCWPLPRRVGDVHERVNPPRHADRREPRALQRCGTSVAERLARSRPSSTAVVQADGNFILYRWSGAPAWAAGLYSPGAYVVVQNDGNACSKVRPRQRCRTGWNLRGTLGCIPPTPTHPQVISHGVAQHPAGPFGKNQPTPRLPRTTRLRRTQGERGRVTRPWRSPLCNRREPWPRNLRDLDRGGPPPRACATDVRFRRRAIGIHRTAHSRSLPMQHCGPHLPSLSSSAAGSSSDPARGSPPSSSFGPGGPPATRTRRLLRLTA